MNKIPFLRTSQPTWPNAESVVGEFRGDVKGKYKCWEVRDRDDEPFRTILDCVRHELEQGCGRVPKSYLIGYDIFMIGESPEGSIPHIMFHCSKEGPRKEAMNYIKKSGLLKEYKGLGVGQWKSPPHLPNISLAAEILDNDVASQPLFRLATGLGATHNRPFSDTRPLELLVADRAGHTPRKATVALSACFGNEPCFLAPSHVFMGDITIPGETSGDDDAEFSAFDENQDPYAANDDLDETDLLSRGSQSPDIAQFPMFEDGDVFEEPLALDRATSWSSDSTASESASDWRWSPRLSMQDTPKFLQASLDGCKFVCPSMDYVLIPAKPGSVVFFNVTELCATTVGQITEKMTPIYTEYTCGRVCTGMLRNMPSHMQFPGASTFQKVYPATFPGGLKAGDSGAAVSCLASGKILGHVVAGSFDAGVAFIVPACDVLSSIRREETKPQQSAAGESYRCQFPADSVIVDLEWNRLLDVMAGQSISESSCSQYGCSQCSICKRQRSQY